jgi:hypothetical protein
MASKENNGIIETSDAMESREEQAFGEKTGPTESRSCDMDIGVSEDKDTQNSNKDVILKLIVPEMRMNFPSYVIGSIALVTSSLSNSGTLVLFYFTFFIAVFCASQSQGVGFVARSHHSCYICSSLPHPWLQRSPRP